MVNGPTVGSFPQLKFSYGSGSGGRFAELSPALHLLRRRVPPQLLPGRRVTEHHPAGRVHPGAGTGKIPGRRPLPPPHPGPAHHRGGGRPSLPTPSRFSPCPGSCWRPWRRFTTSRPGGWPWAPAPPPANICCPRPWAVSARFIPASALSCPSPTPAPSPSAS